MRNKKGKYSNRTTFSFLISYFSFLISFIRTWVRLQNPKFSFLKKSFNKRSFRLLDIGTGNHSATKTVSLFPACEYYGLDINKNYLNSEDDFKVMRTFYEMDLTELNFSNLPDHFFDAIWIVHVIEHLYNGDKVLEGLFPKLQPGGYMYVEYPSEKSTRLPSMRGTLNFKDDQSHVRVYSIPELERLFKNHNFRVLNSGYRRSIFYIVMIPFRVGWRWLRGKSVTGNIFWDLLGFAEYLWVRKT